MTAGGSTSGQVAALKGPAPRRKKVPPEAGRLPRTLEIPVSVNPPLTNTMSVRIDSGDRIFVLGANGTGKSSLMHAIYHAHSTFARRITAHRQTWLSSGSISITGEQKRQTQNSIQSMDTQAEARWKDDYSAQRTSVAIYELFDAENVRAREIADAVTENDLARASDLARDESPIQAINELLRLSNIPIQISIHKDEQLIARKSGGPLYSVAELSDGERNALLIAANVLTALPGTLILIDEPERHLHRSIIAPLLTSLFAKRQDCAFVISTHDIMLPMDDSGARTLLVRGCTYDETRAVSEWVIDQLPANAPLDDALKADILGARRKVLFVEGDDKSLDCKIYSLLFPDVSVIPKGGCVEVENGVTGIRGASHLHWVHPFGVVDNDRRHPAEIARLLAKGVYATAVHSVESIYFHPEIQLRVALRHSDVTGADAAALLSKAKDAAIRTISHADIARLSARAIEKEVHEAVQRGIPTQSQIASGTPVAINIDIGKMLADEQSEFERLVASKDLEKIISRYPIRETQVLSIVSRSLGFQDRKQYEGAVVKLFMDDAAALTFARNLFGSLYSDMNR
jgi:ABC-type cobalamin/Fe3+-siderophores transport system ATPase subunit